MQPFAISTRNGIDPVFAEMNDEQRMIKRRQSRRESLRSTLLIPAFHVSRVRF